MHTGLTIFHALDFGAAINRVLKCTWQESVHTGMKIFDALAFGEAINRLLKCTWHEKLHIGFGIFDALDFGAAGGSCVHLARNYAHRYENI